MLPTPPQSDAAAGEIKEFHNWAGRGAADLILPEIDEKPLVAEVKADLILNRSKGDPRSIEAQVSEI